MNYLLVLLLCILVNEALVELMKSGFFEFVREFFLARQEKNKFYNFIYRLVNCGYCFSVWSSVFLTILVFSLLSINLTGCFILDALFFFMLTHRLSNFFHDSWDRYVSKEVLQ